jgi:hypothetical protein
MAMRTPSALISRNVVSARLKSRTGGVRDLDFEAPRRKAGVEQGSMQLLDEVGIVKLHRRDVDGHGQRLLPCRGLAASRLDDPVADLQNRAALLSNRNKDRGPNLAADRMLQRNNASKPVMASFCVSFCG